MNAWAAIRLATPLIFFSDPHQEFLVGLGPLAFWTIVPGIVSASTDIQHSAYAFHTVLTFMQCHKLVPQLPGREKMFTAFFRISRSSSTSTSFCCKRRISAL